MERKKKILLISLGTGSIFGRNAAELSPEEKKEKILKKEFSYRMANYCMDGRAETIETAFVAEPLMKYFQPDEVFIIGTVKSAWAGFFCKFGNDSDEKTIQRLLEIEENGNKDLADSELKECSQEIENIYAEGLNSEYFSNVKIHLLMIRYGISEAELRENYRLLSSIETVLDRRNSYEAAFDITHSFRSLPLYNLVILHYLKNVSQIDLNISHVYYGNLDIQSENGGIAPIIDLKELTEVLDLCNGVNEFKNTGNAKSLLQYIPNTEENLKTALEKFDWATQINSYDKIIHALKELIKATEYQSDGAGDKFTDLRGMIYRVIMLKFLGENENGQVTAQDFEKFPIGEKQFLICKWYYQQNRYGQAVATGMEALRSLLIPIYLVYRYQNLDEMLLGDEKHRKQAVDRLSLVCKELQSAGRELTPIEALLCDLEKSRKAAVPVRNMFAHNLSESLKKENNEDVRRERKETEEETIKIFIQKLEEFHTCLHKHCQEIKEIYQRDFKGAKVRAERSAGPVRIIVAPQASQIPYDNYRQSSNKNRYSVFRLPDKIEEYLGRNSNQKGNRLVNTSLFLTRYIADLGFDLNGLQIIFHHLPAKQMIHYSAALYSLDIKHIYDQEKLEVPRISFEIRWEKYEDFVMNDEQAELMKLDVLEV